MENKTHQNPLIEKIKSKGTIIDFFLSYFTFTNLAPRVGHGSKRGGNILPMAQN